MAKDTLALTRGALLMARDYLSYIGNKWDNGESRGFTPPGASLAAVNLALAELDGKPRLTDAIARGIYAQARSAANV